MEVTIVTTLFISFDNIFIKTSPPYHARAPIRVLYYEDIIIFVVSDCTGTYTIYVIIYRRRKRYGKEEQYVSSYTRRVNKMFYLLFMKAYEIDVPIERSKRIGTSLAIYFTTDARIL